MPGSTAYAQQPVLLNSGCLLQLRARRRQAACLGTINAQEGYIHVPGSPGTSVCEWTGALAPGGSPRCVSEGSMSAMERTTNHPSHPSQDSNAFAFDEPRRDPQRAPSTSGPSADSSSDDFIPLFLSDLQGQLDPPKLAPFAASQRTSLLPRVVAGGLVISALAILIAVFNSDVTHVLVDKARGVAPASVNAIPPRSEKPSRGDILSAYHTALQNQAPPARRGIEAAAPSKTLGAETLAALMTRAKSLL